MRASQNGERMLFAHRFLMRIGLTIGNVFAWIFAFFLFEQLTRSEGVALICVALIYAFVQIATLVVTPFSAAHLRGGSRRALIWGAIIAASAYVWLGTTLEGSASDLASGVTIFAILLGIYRAFYWVPYELLETVNSRKAPRMHAMYDVLIALSPLAAGASVGLIMDAPLRIFGGAAAAICISILPAFFLHDTYEDYSWGYGETFRRLFARRHRKIVLPAFYDGMQGAVLFLVWPLAIFLIINQSFSMFGLIFTISLLGILTLRGVYDTFLKKAKFEASSPVQATIAVAGWVMRFIAGLPASIVVADIFSYSTLPPRGGTTDPFAFEQIADQGAYIDEYTALKEMALALGRLALACIVIVVALLFSSLYAFAASLVVAAIAASLSITLARTSRKSAY